MANPTIIRPEESVEHSTVGATLARFNPVAALWLVKVRAGDNVLQNATVLFDRSDRTDVVVVAGHQDALDTELVAGDLDGQTEDRSCVAQPTELWNDDIADMPAYTLKKLIE